MSPATQAIAAGDVFAPEILSVRSADVTSRGVMYAGEVYLTPHPLSFYKDICESLYMEKSTSSINPVDNKGKLIPVPIEITQEESEIKKRNQRLLSHAEDEFNPENPRTITLNEVFLHPTNQSDTRFVESWKYQYENLAKHRAPEENSERTKFIEKIIKDTLNKEGKSELAAKVRVIILTRGEEINAFAGPDCTIFLTQGLLNTMEDLDLIMGVVFHELSHIENEDYAVKNANFGQLRFVQEPAADLKLTTRYLDVSNLNTLGLDKALKKLELSSGGTGKSRDYQEHAQRSLAIKAQVMTEHFVNDNLPLSKSPDFMNKEVVGTNFEILQKISKSGDSESIAKILKLLGKSDLRAVSYNSEIYSKVYRELNQLYAERLSELGFAQEQINYYIFCTQPAEGPLNTNYINSSEELLHISEQLTILEGQNKNENLIKGKNHLENSQTVVSHSFLISLKSYMVNENDSSFSDRKEGAPVNTETLLQILKNYSDYLTQTGNLDRYSADILINEIITKYALLCVNTENETLEEFFTKVKNSGLPYKVSESVIQEILYSNNNSKFNFGQRILQTKYDRRIESAEALRTVYGIEEIKEEKKEPLLDIEYVKKELSELLTLPASEASDKFNSLIDDLNLYFKKNQTPEAEVVAIIQEILNAIDKLPLNDSKYFDKTGKYPFATNALAFVKEGRDYYLNDANNNVEITPEYMEEARELSTFNLKLITLCKLYKKDSEEFYSQLKEIMSNSKIKIEELDQVQMMRLIGPLISIDINGTPSRYASFAFSPSRPRVFQFTNAGMQISEIQKIETLPFVEAFLKKQNTEIEQISTFEELRTYYTKRESEFHEYLKGLYDYASSEKVNPFEDNLFQIEFFESARKTYLKLLESTNFEDENLNLAELYELTKVILPENITTKEILKKIRMSFLSGSAEFSAKIEFFKQNAEELTYDDLLQLSEQIKGDPNIPGSMWAEWQLMESALENIINRYLSGEISTESKRKIDALASEMSKLGDITKTTDASESSSQTNKLASMWISTSIGSSISLIRDEFGSSLPLVYDKTSGLYKVPVASREYFRSFSDGIRELQNLSIIERMYLVEKALISSSGLLATDERRSELAETLRASLNLEDSFISELAKTLTMEARPGTESRDVYTLLASNILGQKLFDSFDVSQVNVEEIYKKLEGSYQRGILSKEDIERILKGDTRTISAQGAQYFHRDSRIISGRVAAVEDSYKAAISILSARFLKAETAEREGEESMSLVPENLEVLFKGAEGTILGARALQITRQMRRFEDPNIDRRMALSFDANPGLDRFRFFKALSAAAKNDPELASFLSTRLVAVEKKLGGGSMATTYKAVVTTGENSTETREVAIRALVPGAELQIRTISDTILNSITIIEESIRTPDETQAEYDEKIRNAKLTRSIIKLATDWCISDINDGVYEERDDKFRTETMQRFNMVSAEDRFVAPDRIHTSFRNWVRVEGLATGVTARKFLDDPSVSEEMKSEVVKQIILFNRYQYEQKPTTEGGTVVVQSDPSIGNYLVEIVDGKPKIHVLDRGLMIPMSEERLEMMNLLIKGKKIEFLNKFLDEIIEYNARNNPSYEFLRSGNRILSSSLKADLVASIIPKVVGSALFSNAKSMLDIVTIINDTLIENKLQLPWELQLPIKNMVGMELLMNNYVRKRV